MSAYNCICCIQQGLFQKISQGGGGGGGENREKVWAGGGGGGLNSVRQCTIYIVGGSGFESLRGGGGGAKHFQGGPDKV